MYDLIVLRHFAHSKKKLNSVCAQNQCIKIRSLRNTYAATSKLMIIGRHINCQAIMSSAMVVRLCTQMQLFSIRNRNHFAFANFCFHSRN